MTEDICQLRVYRTNINNSDNDRLSFDASKTGGCKLTRIAGEGCDSTEPGVCSFVLGTYL